LELESSIANFRPQGVKGSKFMTITTVPTKTYNNVHYSIDAIKEEARSLVYQGKISRQQPIYTLCQFIPPREWACVECELEECEYLLRDRIADLLGHEEWEND
jgi:hypothetical protein